jgi:hypothetical protein
MALTKVIGSGIQGLDIKSTGVHTLSVPTIFHVTKNTDQSLSDATTTVVTFESATDDSNGGRTINQGDLYSSNAFTATAATAGYYFVYISIFFQMTQDMGDFHMYFRVTPSGGSAETHQVVYTNAGQGNNLRFGTVFNHQILKLDSGDALNLIAYADAASSGTTNLNHNSVNIQRTNMGGWKIA